MDDIQTIPDLVESARLDVLQRYSDHLQAEVALARQGGGFFDKKYWTAYILTKKQWQEASNHLCTLLHELSK